jgi:hypothetical protein
MTAAPPIQWSGGVATRLEEDSGGAKLALGPVPAYSFASDVFRVDLASQTSEMWVERACPSVIEEVMTERVPTVILCRLPEMVLVHADGEQRIEVPGHPILARWLGDVLAVATFEGEIALWDGKVWTRVPTGAGPVATAFALDDERLLVTTESMVTRVLDRTVGTWVVDLPRGFDVSVPTPTGIRGLHAAGGVDYEWAWDGMAAGLDASDFGGVAGMALHEDGELLAIGHSEGSVDLWNTETGELKRFALEGENVAKALLWRGDTLMVNNGASHQWTDGVWQHSPTTEYLRRLYGVGGLVVRWAPPGRLQFDDIEGQRLAEFVMEEPPSDMASDGHKLWTLDTLGNVRTVTIDGIHDEFTVPGFGRVVVVGGGKVAVATEDEVMLLTPFGERLWAVPVTSPVTELAVNDRFVAVGTQTGRVDVHDATTGRLLAEHQPHTRRVSQMILADDVLFTASWDGLVTRMGLRPLTASPRELQAETVAAWSFGVEDLQD